MTRRVLEKRYGLSLEPAGVGTVRTSEDIPWFDFSSDVLLSSGTKDVSRGADVRVFTLPRPLGLELLSQPSALLKGSCCIQGEEDIFRKTRLLWPKFQERVEK